MSVFDFPITMTASGAQPQSPLDLRAQLLAAVSATNPGYTANLPGSLVEDVSSTEVAGVALCDQARVDLINSMTPLGANEFILTQLGQIYGIPPGTDTNTSVQVVFYGTPGFVIALGFTISDGSNQYTVKDGGIIGTGGSSLSLSTFATQSGTWAVPANSVTQIVTSVPSSITLSVTNPQAGTPSTTTQTPEDYRTQVLQAGLVASQGMSRCLKTLLVNVPGVQPRLISTRQQSGGGWEVLCGGGDNYQVAYAIYSAMFDISTLVGSMVTDGRNIVVTINDYPDTYAVPFVRPPQQSVSMVVTWNTTASNFTGGGAVAQLASPALVAYVNSIAAGQPMNLFALQSAFQTAVVSVLSAELLTRLVFAVSINGMGVPPETGTGIIAGDPEGYFMTSSAAIVISQG